MAAKIDGIFELDDHSFDFTAIAFGRIGGQNIGAQLSDNTQKTLSDLGYNVDNVIDELQKNLVKGNITIPDDVKRESFADD